MSSSSEAKVRIQARKIRQGTHSCWECRRRKIRCQFSAPDDLVCTPCRNRGSICRGQELSDEAEASHLSMRHLARRLGKLEELMERLAERSALSASSDGLFTQDSAGFSLAGLNRVEQPHPTMTREPADTPGRPREPISSSSHNTTASPTSGTTQKTHMELAWDQTIAETLYKLFPSQKDVNTIHKASVGPTFVTTLFHCHADVAEGISEPPEAIGALPSPSSRPTLLAKRLLQLVICMQQLSPRFDCPLPSVRASMLRTMEDIVGALDNFIAADRFASTFEGLECLLLLGYWQQNAGNLRKAWLIFRRAISVGQFIGIDTTPVSPPNTPFSSRYPPSPAMLWFRSVACDRYLSLLLGLPAGSHDNSFAAQTARDAPWEKLEKLHAVVSEKMIERNSSTQTQADRLTQLISRDLIAGVDLMGREWWKLPVVDKKQSPESVPEAAGRMILQMNHHLLLILLHIPFLLQNPLLSHDQQSSKTICTSSSRNVLERFRAFRRLNDSAFSCRHVDYAALVAAMTLLVSHAQDAEVGDSMNDESIQRGRDRALIIAVKDRMKNLAYLNSDRFFEESTDIVDRLLSLLNTTGAEALTPDSLIHPRVELRIPYFGTIKISVPPVRSAPVRGAQQAEGVETLVPPLNGDTETSMASSGSSQEASNDASERFVPVHFLPENQQINFSASDVTAGADAWALQGIDATYWALLQMDWNP